MKIAIFILCLFSFAMASFEIEEIVSEEVEVSNEGSAAMDEDKPFEYKPSEKLKAIEDKMPRNQKELVKDGKAKETMIHTFNESMASEVAQKQLAKLNNEWHVMINGPEAPRVINTVSGNLREVMTSHYGSKFIITVFATAQALLTKAGDQQTHSNDLGNVLSMIVTLFSLPNMPDIINKTSTLILEAVNKRNAAMYVRQFWGEVKKSLSDELLPSKLDLCFSNTMFLMKAYNDKMSPAKPKKQLRSQHNN